MQISYFKGDGAGVSIVCGGVFNSSNRVSAHKGTNKFKFRQLQRKSVQTHVRGALSAQTHVRSTSSAEIHVRSKFNLQTHVPNSIKV